LTPKAGRITTSSLGHVLDPVAVLPVEEAHAELDEALVDVRVVNDLVRDVDRLLREVAARLVGQVDGPVDAVAEAELLGEPQLDVVDRQAVAALAHDVHELAVVVALEQVLDLGLEAEALLDVERVRHAWPPGAGSYQVSCREPPGILLTP
jgi:hypothetical protein